MQLEQGPEGGLLLETRSHKCKSSVHSLESPALPSSRGGLSRSGCQSSFPLLPPVGHLLVLEDKPKEGVVSREVVRGFGVLTDLSLVSNLHARLPSTEEPWGPLKCHPDSTCPRPELQVPGRVPGSRGTEA